MTPLRTSISIGSAASGRRNDWDEVVRYVVECERLGVDGCWSAEAWGQDAVVPLAFLAARTERIRLGSGIMQISARVPSTTAMTAMTLAAVSAGRFMLGLGVSGPQVVEGLHGVPFERPLGRMREYLDILTLAFQGRALEYPGDFYRLPLPGGEGKALRLAQVPEHPVPIYLAVLGPKGLELLGERGDGWVGTCFVPEAADVYFDPIRAGTARTGRDFGSLDLQAGGTLAFEEEEAQTLESCRADLAFQLGAMGSRDTNFYSAAIARAGFDDVVEHVRALWFAGRRDDARAAVTDELVRRTALIGDDTQIADRVRLMRSAGVTTIRLDPGKGPVSKRLDTIARALDVVRTVNAETP